MKKFSLLKNSVTALRMFGNHSQFSFENSLEAALLDLYIEIHHMNTLQLVGEKIYFEIDKNEKFVGPWLEVIGLPQVKNSGLGFIDLRNVTQFSGILWTSAPNEAINMVSISEVLKVYREIVKKIVPQKAFLAIEMDKIELHFFV